MTSGHLLNLQRTNGRLKLLTFHGSTLKLDLKQAKK
jgi:hypothetical protein